MGTKIVDQGENWREKDPADDPFKVRPTVMGTKIMDQGENWHEKDPADDPCKVRTTQKRRKFENPRVIDRDRRAVDDLATDG